MLRLPGIAHVAVASGAFRSVSPGSFTCCVQGTALPGVLHISGYLQRHIEAAY